MRETVGMVFQRFNLFPHMTMPDNLIMAPMEVRKLPRTQAVKQTSVLLENVGLSDKIDTWQRPFG